jgi:hypothetical protein
MYTDADAELWYEFIGKLQDLLFYSRICLYVHIHFDIFLQFPYTLMIFILNTHNQILGYMKLA